MLVRRLHAFDICYHFRNQFTSLISLIIVLTVSKAKGNQISCERKTFESWGDVGSQNTCWMKKSTSIGSDDVKLLPDAAIGALFFDKNKKISFLPVDVGISFPRLKLYSAYRCSIKTIAKVHFKGLKMLRRLHLDNNQIETIKSNTFEDLNSLEELYLSKKNNFFIFFSF